MPNNSPWIHQLNHERPNKKLDKDVSTDVVVVGAGIAGISTAFYLLKHTDKKVVIVEAYKMAHGATGHNAGQLVSYFERPFRELVEEFGLDMAAQGQRDIDSSWELADEMYTEAGLNIPMSRFISYAGLSTKEQIVGHLENHRWKRKAGFFTSPVAVWDGAPFLRELSDEYHDQIELISKEEIALKLETFDSQYIAVLSAQKGVMNSALFCQEVMSYLLDKHKDRFDLYEHTPIKKVVAHPEKVILDADKHTLECAQVVLCTNGFDNFDILTHEGLSVNTRFHHNISGVIAFMSGYLESHTGIPAAISYFPKEDPGLTDNPGDPYFYVTRRSYEYDKDKKHNLVCIGGPDFSLENRMRYDRDLDFSGIAKQVLDDFVKKTYDKHDDMQYIFMWHGLMGYTKNLLRMIGPDFNYPNIFYNLGCNGNGLLPSIFGGSKVAKFIAGEQFAPSVFDVPAIIKVEGDSKKATLTS